MVKKRLTTWKSQDWGRRLWSKDPTLWGDTLPAKTQQEITERLGWLDAALDLRQEIDTMQAFAKVVIQEGINQVVLLGMGGSSLAPEVLMRTFGHAPGYPVLAVLDSTNPDAIEALAKTLDAPRTLFVVASKSGGTLETLSLYRYFFKWMGERVDRPGEHFIAITDPGSKLEIEARTRSFRRCFLAPPTVGGRYSALTAFGLVPAALIGVDLNRMADEVDAMVTSVGPKVPVQDNPALVLGAIMGEMALQGCDKLTLITSPAIGHFGVWVEQLIAESTGKAGRGILPVVQEYLGHPQDYSADRLFVSLRCETDDNQEIDFLVEGLRQQQRAVLEIPVADPYQIAGQMLLWEVATAAAGAVLGINPFDQPNVESAKVQAKRLMTTYSETHVLPAPKVDLVDEIFEVSWDGVGDAGNPAEALARFFSDVGDGDYVGLMAYLPDMGADGGILAEVRNRLRNRLHCAVTVGYGPRFLHSTGQLHKGDGNRGVFLQITQTAFTGLDIPGEPYDFGTVILAQALGDRQALLDGKRRVMRLHISRAGAAARYAALEQLWAAAQSL